MLKSLCSISVINNMSNSQQTHNFVPTPQGSKQSTDYGPYNFEQIHTARKSLNQSVCNSHIQWLCSTMRFNSFGKGRVTTSNLWEGDSGMMEHVQIPFPLPPCTSFSPEKSISDSFVKDPPTLENSDNYQHQSYEDFSEKQSNMSKSWDVKESFRGTETFGAMTADSTFNNSTTTKSQTGGRVGTKAGKLKLIRRITEINNNVNNTHEKLSAEETRLSNGYLKVRKKACQKLADLHRVTLMHQNKLEIAKKQVGRCGYEKPMFNIGAPRWHKKHHNLQDELVSIFSNTVINFDSLRSRFKDILCNNTRLIEPHRFILNKAISDLLEGSHKDDVPLLHRKSENEWEGSPVHLKNSLQSSMPGEDNKYNDNSRKSNSRDLVS